VYISYGTRRREESCTHLSVWVGAGLGRMGLKCDVVVDRVVVVDEVEVEVEVVGVVVAGVVVEVVVEVVLSRNGAAVSVPRY
jgi:hypothetical protein